MLRQQRQALEGKGGAAGGGGGRGGGVEARGSNKQLNVVHGRGARRDEICLLTTLVKVL